MKNIRMFLLMLLFLMLLPVVVQAKVCDTSKITMSSITIENKDGRVLEKKDASAIDKTVDVDLSMAEVGDKIRYKIVLTNDSDDDYAISSNDMNLSSEYIDYKVTFADNSNIVNARASKTMYLEVTYVKQVAEDSFTSGVYTDSKSFKVPLSFDVEDSEIENPNTGAETKIISTILVLVVILGTGIVLYVIMKKKCILMIVALIIIIPISVYALCKTEVFINAKVTIVTGEEPSKFKVSCLEDEFSYYEGMTFGDWIKSDFYPGEVYGYYESQEECENIWGTNKGCGPITLYLNDRAEKYYYPTLAECQDKTNDECSHITGTIYSYVSYITVEECEEEDGDRCVYENGEYHYYYKDFYETYDDCLDDGVEATQCKEETEAYQYVDRWVLEYDTLEECEDDNETGCYSGTRYSPTPRGNVNDNANERVDIGIYLSAGDIWRIAFRNLTTYMFLYKELTDEITNEEPYTCMYVKPAECVSPESEIQTGYGRTTKAKDLKENDSIAYYDFEEEKILIGKVKEKYIHKDATQFIRYTLEDGTYLEATDYHPIYTKEGWKSYTNRNNYPIPEIGDEVLTSDGYKKITKIETYEGKEDFIDFKVETVNGKIVDNYYANGILVEGSY